MTTAVARPKRVVEYGDIPDGMLSQRTILSQRENDERRWTLTHHLPGYECAGSMARWTDERWSVLFPHGGATHGRSFLSEDKAREYLAAVAGVGR